nr:hypothetical protein OG999_00685 [Streptomyces sp. NBC_00886]
MHEGRYTLRHSDQQAAHGVRFGLGLENTGFWTGRSRKTDTVSGPLAGDSAQDLKVAQLEHDRPGVMAEGQSAWREPRNALAGSWCYVRAGAA